MRPATLCEYPSVTSWVFPNLGSKNSQNCSAGGHRYSSFVRLGVRSCDQYYTIGTTTLLFYDYLLTLGDEVLRCVINIHPTRLISLKGQIRLVRKEIMGYAEADSRYGVR